MFGRGRDEDGGIAGLGHLSSGTAAPAPVPAGLPAGAPQPAVDRVLPDWPLALVMTVVAVFGGWIGVASRWGGSGEAARVSLPAVGEIPRLVLPGTPEPGPSDYTRPDAFAKGLGALRSEAGARARAILLRVDRGQVWAVLARPGGRRLVVTVSGGRVSSSASPAGPFEGVPLARVDARAPARVLAALRRDGIPASRVDYLVLSDLASTGAGWNVYLTQRAGRIPWYRASLDGRAVERAG